MIHKVTLELYLTFFKFFVRKNEQCGWELVASSKPTCVCRGTDVAS